MKVFVNLYSLFSVLSARNNMKANAFQDVVDPVTDEMLAKFVVDSHFKSQPKGVLVDGKNLSGSQEDLEASGNPVDPEVCTRHFAYFVILSLLHVLNYSLLYVVELLPPFRCFLKIC